MHITNYGIHLSDDPQFAGIVMALSRYVDNVVETGTFLGTGSTQVLAQLGCPVSTIECNPEHVRQASRNLARYPNVTCLNAYSLKRDVMLSFINSDPIHDQREMPIATDSSDARNFYTTELGDHQIPENVLYDLVKGPNRQLILLDSAGGVGWLEFKTIIDLPEEVRRHKFLVLDDIAHVKHFRSASYLEEKYPGGFNRAASNRWGWIDFAKVLA
jgi:hypothetical protein